MTARRWFSNCDVTAPSCVQWPVLCGRIASSLTRMRPSVVSKSSTARMPGDVERTGHPQRDLLRLRRPGPAPGRGRGDDLEADAVELGGGHDRVGRRLAAGRAGDEGGELAAEVDELLGEHLHPRGGGRLERGVGLGELADDPHPLAVVAAAGGLEDARQPEGLDVRDRRRPGAWRGHGMPELVEPGPHDALVLGVHQGAGTGPDGDPGRPRARAGGRSGRARGRRSPPGSRW